MAENITAGDYKVSEAQHIHGDRHDETGRLLRSMHKMSKTLDSTTRDLKAKERQALLLNDDLQRRNLLAKGLTAMECTMHGQIEVKQLAQRVITYLGQHVEALTTGFYHFDGEDMLSLICGYRQAPSAVGSITPGTDHPQPAIKCHQVYP